jgi:hypothetical protein
MNTVRKGFLLPEKETNPGPLYYEAGSPSSQQRSSFGGVRYDRCRQYLYLQVYLFMLHHTHAFVPLVQS